MDENELTKIYLKRLEHKDTVTGRLSESTRYLAFGIVAWVFALHASDSQFSSDLVETYKPTLGIAAFFAASAITLDYFQYLSAYVSVRHAISRPEQEYKYDKRYLAYRIQNFCFIVKQVLVGLSSIIVTTVFALQVGR